MDEKNNVFVNGGWIFNDNGWAIAAVFDCYDGDNDACPERLDLFGLLAEPASMTVEEERLAAFIFLTVTFLFFFEGEVMLVV